MQIVLLILLNMFIWLPIGAFAADQNVPTAHPDGFQSTGIISGVGTPTNTGDVPTTGSVPEAGTPSLVPIKSLSGPVSIDATGSGDNCSAGAQTIQSWTLDPATPVDNKEKLEQVIAVATGSDKRLREVQVYDDAIDMYYLQPAYRWGFLPMNYYLHISANGTTLHMSLDKPAWLGSSTNYHSQVTASFSANAPTLLSSDVVSSLSNSGTIARDAKMIEVVSAIMYGVNVEPVANSFFVCYIVPFLVYIFFAILIGAVILWFIIRRFRKASGFEIHRAGGNDGDDDDAPMFPGISSSRK